MGCLTSRGSAVRSRQLPPRPRSSGAFFMPFTLYIIYSVKLDKFYVGYTGDNIEERIRKHNSKHKGFSGKTSGWKIDYTEGFCTKEEAYRRERQIKSWKSRKMIEALIGTEHPDL